MNIYSDNSNISPITAYSDAHDSDDFNNLVLKHIKEVRPDGTLDELLNEMKALSPDTPRTMQQLNSALQYSDAILRTDPDYADYTTAVLDKKTAQLSGLNMLMHNMLYKSLLNNNEEKDSI